MKILICLFLICAFLVSGVSQILDFDFSVTPPSSGNGSGGETTEPDPEPDPDSVVLSWHQEDCNGHFNYVTSGSCCGDETEFELVIENEQHLEVKIHSSWGKE